MGLWLLWQLQGLPGFIPLAVLAKGGNPTSFLFWPMIWVTGIYPVMARRNSQPHILTEWLQRG
jgi:hypothetical protein